jgi:hypothetical protein
MSGDKDIDNIEERRKFEGEAADFFAACCQSALMNGVIPGLLFDDI